MPVRRAIRVWMRAAGTAAALVLLAASNAHASRLRLLVPSVTSFASDGSSYVAWQTTRSGPLTVLNTATSRRRRLNGSPAAPAGSSRPPGPCG